MSIQGSLPLADGMSLRIAGLGQASERFVDPRSLSDSDRSTAANDLRPSASFSARSQEP